MRPHATAPGPAIESKIRCALPRLYAWYRRSRRPLPWRTRPTPYRTAVAEFMCQQTRITTVIPYYLRWMKTFPSWKILARAPAARVLRMWEGLGYYRRARSLHSLAKAVLRLPGKELPSEPNLLRLLPGIGDYTAGAIASIAFTQAAAAFDGNVARVLGRFTAQKGKSPGVPFLRTMAGRIVPGRNPGLHNQALMELGALVCLPKNPRCSACPWKRVCPSSEKLPRPVRRRPSPIRSREYVLLARRNRKIWLTRHHPAGRWRGLALLPTLKIKPLGTPRLRIQYPYTRHLVSVDVFMVERPPRGLPGKWIGPAGIRSATLPAPHRKILKKLGIG